MESLAVSFLLVLFLSSAAASSSTQTFPSDDPTSVKESGVGGKLGGREKMKNVESNTEIQSLGRFCVDEFNKKSAKGTLRFNRVVEAERQVVSGMKYFLKIEAEERDIKKDFEAVVVVKAWLHSREMLSFGPAAGH